jgi:hypothetical protein
MRRTNRLLSWTVLFGALSTISGCDPPPPKVQEMGKIVFRESDVPGNDRPYALPEHLRNLKGDERPDQGSPPGE